MNQSEIHDDQTTYSSLFTPVAQEEIEHLTKRGRRLDPAEAEQLADNPFLPSPVLKELAKHRTKYVLNSVAFNRNTPPEVLEELSFERKIDILCNIALNPNTPIHVLERLADHKNPKVRSFVAANTRCPEDVLYKLTADPSWRVRYNVELPPSNSQEPLRETA